MMKKRVICIIMCLLSIFVTACGNTDPQTPKNTRPSNNADQDIINSILAETKDEVITYRTSGAVVEDVDLVNEGTILTNAKTEFKIDVSNVQGNPYDPDMVNVYGEFITPSQKVTLLPAFWTQDYAIDFVAWDKTQNYALTGNNLWATTNATARGVLDHTQTDISCVRLILNNASANAYRSISVPAVEITGRPNIFFHLKNMGDSAVSNLQVQLRQSSNASNNATYTIGSLPAGDWVRFSVPYADFAKSGTAELYEMNQLLVTGAAGTFLMYGIGLENAVGGNVLTLLDLSVPQFTQFYAGDNWTGEEQRVNKTASSSGNLPTVGEQYFCLRYNPREAGDYTYRVTYKENNMVVATYTSTFTAVEDEDAKGLIQIETTQNRNFVFENGEPYSPLGMNIGWYGELDKSSDKATFEYFNYFERMNEVGMNWTRMWLSHWQFSMHNNTDGIMRFDSRLENAARFDAVLAKAEEEEVYIALCLLIHGAFVAGSDGWQSWHTNPFNSANGGYIDTNNPISFLWEERAIADFKKITRYTIARWSYSEAIMSWELWNEVGHLRNYDNNEAASVAWHEEIGEYIKGIDQMPHMVTTSSRGIDGQIFGVNAMDYSNSHSYGSQYGNVMIQSQYNMWQKWNKPSHYSEIGPSGNNNVENFQSDPTGLYLAQSAWAGAMGFGAGGAMTWWWEAVHQRDLYYRFEATSKYLNMIDSDYVSMPSIMGAQSGATTADYAFTGTGSNSMRAVGYRDNTRAFAYLYNSAWNNANTGGNTLNGSVFTMKGLDNGAYTVQIVDAYTGDVISTTNGTAASNEITINLPAFSRQIAVIIRAA